MKAFLRSARIAPKKLNVIAQMVRGLTVSEALDALAHTHKKAARLIETLLKSAVANATHNFKQRPEELVIRSIVVNQGSSYRRGVPMARGRTRPMRKFLSHLEIVLGIADGESADGKSTKKTRSTKSEQKASQDAKKTVKGSVHSKKSSSPST